jgi:hypothetical protein
MFIQFSVYYYPKVSNRIKIAHDNMVNGDIIIESFPKQVNRFHCIPESYERFIESQIKQTNPNRLPSRSRSYVSRTKRMMRDK